MRLLHLLASHDATRRTGVPRFGAYLKSAFPEIVNVTPQDKIDWRDDDLVITDNGLCMGVPDRVRCIVVHHGNAVFHYEQDVAWQNEGTRRMAYDQTRMLTRPNTTFVAPSAWVAQKFGQIAGWERNRFTKQIDRKGYEPVVIPHWVPLIEGVETGSGTIVRRPVIIGDFRNPNKGSGLLDKYREAMPQYEFRQLDFDGDEARASFYRAADCYLCLSLSEGAPYAVADAEAASLPIVSTMVGNCVEFAGDDWYGISTRFHPEFGVEEAANAIRAAVETGRRSPSFYEKYDFAEWKRRWESVIGGAAVGL